MSTPLAAPAHLGGPRARATPELPAPPRAAPHRARARRARREPRSGAPAPVVSSRGANFISASRRAGLYRLSQLALRPSHVRARRARHVGARRGVEEATGLKGEPDALARHHRRVLRPHHASRQRRAKGRHRRLAPAARRASTSSVVGRQAPREAADWDTRLPGSVPPGRRRSPTGLSAGSPLARGRTRAGRTRGALPSQTQARAGMRWARRGGCGARCSQSANAAPSVGASRAAHFVREHRRACRRRCGAGGRARTCPRRRRWTPHGSTSASRPVRHVARHVQPRDEKVGGGAVAGGA